MQYQVEGFVGPGKPQTGSQHTQKKNRPGHEKRVRGKQLKEGDRCGKGVPQTREPEVMIPHQQFTGEHNPKEQKTKGKFKEVPYKAGTASAIS